MSEGSMWSLEDLEKKLTEKGMPCYVQPESAEVLQAALIIPLNSLEEKREEVVTITLIPQIVI